MKILNLGAGNRIIEGADNHDIVNHRDEINLVFDLNDIGEDGMSWLYHILMYKYNGIIAEHVNNYLYDKIEFISVIEHLKITPIEALNECWHLLKPSGQLIVKYPHYLSKTAFDDPTHVRQMTENSLDYVDPDTQFGKDYNYYTQYKWKILTPVEQRVIKNRNVKMVLVPRK